MYSTVTFWYRTITKGIREKKIACMHLSFLFVYKRTKRKIFPNTWLGLSSATLASVRCMQMLMDTAKPQREIKKHQRSTNDKTQLNCHIHVDKWAVWHLQHIVKVHAMHSEWGYDWLSQRASGQPDRRRVLIINHSLMQKARNDAPKKVDQTELDRKQVK